MNTIRMPRKGKITIDQAKRILNSKEMEEKIRTIEKMADEAGPEPDCPGGMTLGPKDELSNKRLDKVIERDMIESMEEDD